jgi:hypothetical protein
MDAMTHDEDTEFEQFARTVRGLDTPPPAPREEIWTRIQAQRGARLNGAGVQSGAESGPTGAHNGAESGLAEAGVTALPVRRPRRQWVQWGAGLAAMLVIGIGLGRLSLQQATSSGPPATAAAPSSQAEDDEVMPGPFRLATTRHLQRTEALLTSLNMDVQRGNTGEVTAWATELLTNTRLLLSSPAAEDPATRRLLEDLELLLAQIAVIPSARAQEEVELILDGLNQSDVLLRLRAATAVRRTVGT